MADVGRAAGVSTATVSFVVNDRRDAGISEATRARVLDSIARLGYRPNLHAQALRTQRTHTIGFVTDEVGIKPPAGQTISGVHDAARRHGRRLLVAHATGDDADELEPVIDDLVDRQIEALVYAVVGTQQIEMVEPFQRLPTILVNCFTAGRELPSVLPAEAAGGRAATDIVLGSGHRRIAHLGGYADSWATKERLKGFRAALRQTGVAEDDVPVRFGNFRSDSGYELARDVLRRRRRPTALLCGNDLMAVGAYFAIKEAGLRIPEDVSVVGYDDQEDIAAYVHPALTTVRLPYYEMGELAAEHLVSSSATTPSRTYATCSVVTRCSVTPPRRQER